MEKHNDNNNNTSKQVLLSVLGVAILIVAVVGISFAAFSYSKEGQVENTIATGAVTMAYNEPENGINITNAIPMTETQGKVLSSTNELFDFTVTAKINYEVVAVKNNVASGTAPADWSADQGRPATAEDPYDEFVKDNNIRLYLESKDSEAGTYTQAMAPKAFLADGTNSVTGSAPTDSMILDTGIFDNRTGTGAGTEFTKYYRLRMWVDSSYELSNESKSFNVKVNAYGKTGTYQLDGHIRKYTVKVNVYGKGTD